METNNSYCIYCHIVPNDKKYYGCTSLKPEYRWGKDGNGYKNNIDFYNDIIFYGWDSIEHIVIAKGLTKDEAEWLEEELIKTNRTYDSEYGYNKFIGIKWTDEQKEARSGENSFLYGKYHTGENNPHYGKHHSKKAKNRISEANKGKRTGANSPHAKKVICITTMTVFNCIKEAADYYGISRQHVGQCCNGKCKSAGKLSDGTKLRWSYLYTKEL